MKPPKNVSESVRRLNPDLYGGADAPTKTAANMLNSYVASMNVAESSDESKLNKTEKARLEYLRWIEMPWIGIQCITLKLGDDCRFTPDLCYIDKLGNFVFEDVKGFQRDDALVKIKTAARIFRWAQFYIVKKCPDGDWDSRLVRP